MATASFHIADSRVEQEAGYLIYGKDFCSFVMSHDQAASNDLFVNVSIRNDQNAPYTLPVLHDDVFLDARRIVPAHYHGPTGVVGSMI